MILREGSPLYEASSSTANQVISCTLRKPELLLLYQEPATCRFREPHNPSPRSVLVLENSFQYDPPIYA